MWSPASDSHGPLSPNTSSTNQSELPSTPTKTLRRKRSSANAALTARPSSLSLREASSGVPLPTNLAMSPNSPYATGGAALGMSPALQINLSTLVLVHTTTSPDGKTSLAHALFEPDFLVDSDNRIIRLGREHWERVRDSVEGLRIVGRNRSGYNNNQSPLETPDQSPNSRDGSFETSRWFSLAPETSPKNSRSTSTLLIQPFGGEDGVASKASDLLAFQIYGVGDSGADICPDSWSNLPNQLKTLLTEAERLSEISNSNLNSGSAISIDDLVEMEDVDAQSQILSLLEK